MNILTTMFAWPDGIVVGNLIASAIWAPLALIHLDRLARKHHRIHMEKIDAVDTRRAQNETVDGEGVRQSEG